MENIAELLKKTRESKNLSLKDVSTATKLRVNVLKAIEEGNFNFLPKTYMYSFLKEYFQYLGLNFEEYKEQIDKYFKRDKKIEPKPKELIFAHPFLMKKKVRYTPAQLNKALYFIYAAIFLSFLAIIYFTIFYEGTEQKPLDLEKTTDTILIKSEQRESPKPISTQDSIRLEFYATDTVWINMVIDNKITEKIVLYPNTIKVWSAGNFFRFTLGNAGGVKIKRDGIELPQLTKEKVAIKNIIVSRDKFYVEPVQKPKPEQEQQKPQILLTPSEIKREVPNLRDTKKIKSN